MDPGSINPAGDLQPVAIGKLVREVIDDLPNNMFAQLSRYLHFSRTQRNHEIGRTTQQPDAQPHQHKHEQQFLHHGILRRNGPHLKNPDDCGNPTLPNRAGQRV